MPLCLSPHVSGERVRRRAVWHPRGGGDARSRLRAAERGQRRARRRDGGALRPNAGRAASADRLRHPGLRQSAMRKR